MESAMECTEREILEETGISSLPRPIRFFKLGFGEYYVFEFERELELNPRDTNEIINTRWATVEEMRSMSVNADIVHYLNAM
jgi:NADH pyrophosphatase NudC (nudix superfamily)